MTAPAIDSDWRHVKNGKLYRVCDHCLIEHPGNQEWIEGVVYYEVGVLIGKPYVRTVARFLERFIQVKR